MQVPVLGKPQIEGGTPLPSLYCNHWVSVKLRSNLWHHSDAAPCVLPVSRGHTCVVVGRVRCELNELRAKYSEI